ncbi:hypothetical protein VRU48_08365 [Pedobacter sp. KR3-3]|uniref:Uncharacterized protein n=1 Tax=Pedobacter albus TaxID=3113905 RepID=A0ABU7I6L1_9SPHI|nr:hypothetical protein [Pedobacter sp. KR3-3]MEE1945118.1 hypothetical protein [Pedobacter sp. KR3-3]
MKRLIFFLILNILFAEKLFAGNPGSNYGCFSYTESLFYTHYLKDDTYSNWGGTYHYYDTGNYIYEVDENSTGCGIINTTSNMHSTGQICFIEKPGNVIVQGDLRTYSGVTPCPLDNGTWFLLLAFGAGGFWLLRTNFKF